MNHPAKNQMKEDVAKLNLANHPLLLRISTDKYGIPILYNKFLLYSIA